MLGGEHESSTRIATKKERRGIGTFSVEEGIGTQEERRRISQNDIDLGVLILDH